MLLSTFITFEFALEGNKSQPEPIAHHTTKRRPELSWNLGMSTTWG